jgi:PhnB protein
MAAEDANKVMHAHLIVDGQSLMAADAPSGMKYEPMKGCALALTYDTADKAKRVFDALGEGGKITMPFGRRSGRTDSGWWTTASGRTGSSTAA